MLLCWVTPSPLRMLRLWQRRFVPLLDRQFPPTGYAYDNDVCLPTPPAFVYDTVCRPRMLRLWQRRLVPPIRPTVSPCWLRL